MSTRILGISAFYHDSAACLVVDGEIVAAAQEERFSRKKHDQRFPKHAIDYCLAEGGIAPDQLDCVAFYEKPLLKFDRLMETYLAYAPAGFRSFVKAMPQWVRQKLHLVRELDRGLQGKYRRGYVFTEHHESHAASAFFPSPFEEAAILTMDGVGEWATSTFGTGRGNQIELTHELRFPHSLGLLYSAFTYFTGFKVNSGEYKLMGLAPYGMPRYRDMILEKILHLREDGSFRLDMSYFSYCQGLTMTGRKFAALFGGPPRRPGDEITQREMDMAASIQSVTEEIMVRSARHVAHVTAMRNLVLAGGVALNCVANGRILEEGIFDQLWMQPAAGDAGGALGAALFVWFHLLGNPRVTDGLRDLQKGSLLGPRFSNQEIGKCLDAAGARYELIEDEDHLAKVTADFIASQKVVGLFSGRMEFGPRALGCRSILGDARSESMQSTMNLKIKFRESFRPFAPAVIQEDVHRWFSFPPATQSPYMMLVTSVHQEKRLPIDPDLDRATGIQARLGFKRSIIPAVTHVDGSARVQTIDVERHGRFYRIVRSFQEKTGCPVVINTSFNIRGEPIVCTPQDAYRCFMATDMDVLVLENFLLRKEDQAAPARGDITRYLSRFEPD